MPRSARGCAHRLDVLYDARVHADPSVDAGVHRAAFVGHDVLRDASVDVRANVGAICPCAAVTGRSRHLDADASGERRADQGDDAQSGAIHRDEC